MPRILVRLSLLLPLWVGLVGQKPIQGQEFRIDSQVYLEESTEPVSHNVTIYSPKLVCDFLMSNESEPQPVEIVVFDTRQKNMVLLDVQRQLRVEIPDLRLIKLVDGLRRETQQNENTKFLVADSYEEEANWSDGWVTLTSPIISYRVRGSQPKNVSILPLYFDFLDHVTRLNASDPTKIPPFPRMRLNRSIKRLGWIPSEVQISVRQNVLFRKSFEATSKHVLIDGLTSNDRKMIEDAKKYWMQYKAVELTEYRGIQPRNLKRILTAQRDAEAVK